MKLRSSRQVQSKTQEPVSVLPRKRRRLEPESRSTLVNVSLEASCQLQGHPGKLQTEPKTSRPLEDISEHSGLLSTSNHQNRKRKSAEAAAGERLKRARLTEKNLRAFETMGGRQRKSAGEKSAGQSSTTTTTTDKDFPIKLQQNNVIYAAFDALAPVDAEAVRERLKQPRESEPPEFLDYQRYLVVTEDYENELGVEISAYPLLAKRTSREMELSGYFQRLNHAWSAVDNHLTVGLSDPQPDLVESYRKTDYPPQMAEALSADLAPSLYNEAMPAYAVEFKSSSGDIKEAKIQCAYDGSVMTEGARNAHLYIGKSDDDFYGKTQALTIAFNGENIDYYGHHALQTPEPPQPAANIVASSEDASSGPADTIKYHQYLLHRDNPRVSLQDFQNAYKHVRNAQAIGYQWATERKDALWEYTNRGNGKISWEAPATALELLETTLPTAFLPVPEESRYEAHDDQADVNHPSATNQDVHQPTPLDNGHTASDPLNIPATPPYSSNGISVQVESQQQLPAPGIPQPREDADINTSGRRKARTRTRQVVAVEGPREVVRTIKSRKTWK